MNLLKEKEIEIVQNKIMMNFQYERTKNLWSQYFRDEKTESDLTKERPSFLLKKKTVYNIFKRLREKGACIRKKDQKWKLIEMMI